MHTDRKIGFAMGILLIGIVAALFFRNEPLLSTTVPGVRREQELNARLRERDVAVYLDDAVRIEPLETAQHDPPWTLRDELQEMDQRNKTAPVPVGARSIAVDSRTKLTEEELDGYRPKKLKKSDEKRQTESSSGLREVFLKEHNPKIGVGEFGALPPLLPVPPLSSDVVELPSLRPTEPLGGKSEHPKDIRVSHFKPPEAFEEYVVRYGDTLSGIAHRMLGSQKRFLEIYNANQDRMASPDRLEVGKPLRIPRVADIERQTY